MNTTSTTNSILLILVLALSNSSCFNFKGDKMEILPTSVTLNQWVIPDYIWNKNERKDLVFLNPGESCQLLAEVQPSNATNKEIKWTTDNPKIATIKKGIVTVHKYGEAIITVTTTNGLTASIKIISYPETD